MHRSIRAAALAAAVTLAVPANAATLYTFAADGIGTNLRSPTNNGVLFPVSQFYNATFSFVLGRDGRFTVPTGVGTTFVQGDIAFTATSERLAITIANGFAPRSSNGSASVSVCGSFGATFPTAIGPVAITPGCGSANFVIGDNSFATSFSGQVRSLVISEVADFQAPFTFAQAVPEPATWALMLTGFAMAGYALRRRRATVAIA